MAEQDEQQTDVKDSLEGQAPPPGPGVSEEPVPVDLEHERAIKVDRRMRRQIRREARQEDVDPEEVGELRVPPVDVDHEHSLIQEAMQAQRQDPASDMRTEHDGGREGEELPSHREGEVWESMDAADDDAGGGRRRVRVQSVAGGEVTAVNLVTGVVSHFKAENLVAPRWRRAHS